MNPYTKKPDKNKVYLYTLSDPITNEIRYVGKTIQSLNCRLATHKCRNRNIKNHTEAWIKSIKNKGLFPKIELLDIVDISNWINEEKFYISYLKSLGIKLTNHSEGGDKSNLGSRWKQSNETKLKLQTIFKSRNYNLTLLNVCNNQKTSFKNFIEICEFFDKNYKSIFSSFKNKSLINKEYVILKQGEFYNPNKRGIKKVQAINIQTNEIIKADSIKHLSKLLKCDNSQIGKCLNNKTIFKKLYTISYDMPK